MLTIKQDVYKRQDMNTGYTNTVNSITAKDLQEFTKALLEQNNRVEVSMTSEETK